MRLHRHVEQLGGDALALESSESRQTLSRRELVSAHRR